MALDSLAITLDGGQGLLTVVAGRRPPPGYSTYRTFLPLPTPQNPQLLLERDRAGGPATSLQRFSMSSPWYSRSATAVARAALRAGLPSYLPSSRWITVCRPDGDGRALLPDVLSEVLGVPHVKLAVRAGRPRPNRKPVLQVSDANGRVLAFVKVGWNDLTCRLVRQEVAVLTRIGRLPTAPRSFLIPGVRWSGRWESVDLLVLEPLPALGARPWRRQQAPPLAPAVEIGNLYGCARHTLEDSQYWTSMSRRVADLGDGSSTALAREAVALVGQRDGATKLQCGTWHGDWTAGNMMTLGERLLAYDWERSATGVPLGLDTAYFLIHRELTRRRPSRRALAVARAALHDLLHELDSNRHAARLLIDLSLLEMTVRFLEARRERMPVDGSVFESALEQSLGDHGD